MNRVTRRALLASGAGGLLAAALPSRRVAAKAARSGVPAPSPPLSVVKKTA